MYVSCYQEWESSPSKHRGNAVRAVVRLQPQRLLCRCVPDAHDEHKAWVNDGLDETQQEAVCRDAGEIVAGGRGHQ